MFIILRRNTCNIYICFMVNIILRVQYHMTIFHVRYKSYPVRNVLWMNTVRVFKLCVGVHLTLNNPTAFYEPMNHYQNANGNSRYYFSIIVEFKHPASLLQSLTKVKVKIKCFFETKTTFKLFFRHIFSHVRRCFVTSFLQTHWLHYYVRTSVICMSNCAFTCDTVSIKLMLQFS